MTRILCSSTAFLRLAGLLSEVPQRCISQPCASRSDLHTDHFQ